MLPIIEEMNKLSTIDIKNQFELIGKGTYRQVYDLNNGFVIKIAHNINTNRREFNIWNKTPAHLQNFLAPCLIDKHYRIIMPKATPVSFERGSFNSYFQQLLGASAYLKFDNELYELAETLKLFYSDLKIPENWGIIEGQHKIIDYEMIN